MENQSPFNQIPPVPLALVLIIAGIELVLSAGQGGFVGGPTAIGWRTGIIQDFGFSPAVWEQVTEFGNTSFDMLKRFVSYLFVHGSFTHALWACVMILAIGKAVGDLYSPISFIIIFFGAAIAGAVVYGMFSPGNTGLFGAYPAIYGLIGAYTYLMWLTLGQTGGNPYRAFSLIGILMGLTLVYGMIFGSSPWWIAELTGFVYGLFIAPIVAPGGWKRFLERLRQR